MYAAPGVSESGEVARFTRRISVLEEPSVVAKLTQSARENGHSTNAEIRQALRYWLAAIEANR